MTVSTVAQYLAALPADRRAALSAVPQGDQMRTCRLSRLAA
ncbi:MAG TPA: hypothetical protein VGI60_10220 [Chthoniobacterales bacterium]